MLSEVVSGKIERVDSWHWMGGWGWAMMAFWIVLVFALVGLVMWLVSQHRGGREGRSEGPESPRDVLDRRLAKGEIDLDEYERAREALRR